MNQLMKILVDENNDYNLIKQNIFYIKFNLYNNVYINV